MTNALQTAILTQLRSRLATSVLATDVDKWDDEQMLYRVFFHGHGLRLTRLGQQFMQHCFKCNKFTTPEPPSFSQLSFLDKQSRLPYFYDKNELAVYDERLAVYLQLVNGNLASLTKLDLLF